VSNPHGRAVSLFSKQGAPSQRGIPSSAEGQRIERWRGRPSAFAEQASTFPLGQPSRCVTSASFSATSAPGSIRTSILRLRRPLRVRSRHGGQWDRHRSRATTRSRPGVFRRTRAALFPLSSGDVASSTGLEPAASAFGGQRSCPTELRRDGTPARTRTRNWRFVVSCDHPFHHQGLAPQAGFDPAASAVTRRRSPD
jgi:hypothetical protein